MRLRTRLSGNNSKFSLLASAAVAVALSGCSSDMQRFADNPTEGKDSIYTSSVPKGVQTGQADDTSVSGRPLADSTAKPRAGYASNAYTYQKSYKQPAYGQPEQVPAGPASSATVTVGAGMTLYSIARANNVTVGQIAAANGLKAPYSVHEGQVLRIPGASTAMLPQARTSEAEPAYAKPEQGLSKGSIHTVRAGDTLFSLGRAYGVHPYKIADLNHLAHNASLSVGQPIQIPAGGTSVASAKLKGQERITAAEAGSNTQQVGKTAASQEEQLPASKATEQAALPEPAQQGQPAPPQASSEPGSSPEQGGLAFRWPAKGRIISEYGSKPNGLRNEGINISVPEGTSVRAAEGGIVAYAGNELKGYGNLVLIRHEGGWVTAYAHNKELFVKRGDAVKRGDIISKAGQTGSVTSPQLHFEVRKGATAVDPMRFLNSATAEN
jgi:murein DD-endopeptidase MepM/ murein hydrolase activator NlpD